MTREQYLLTCLMEECGEVVQAASKHIRHGANNYNPINPNYTNEAMLADELTDVMAIMGMLGWEIKWSGENHDRAEIKKIRIERFMKDAGIQ